MIRIASPKNARPNLWLLTSFGEGFDTSAETVKLHKLISSKTFIHPDDLAIGFAHSDAYKEVKSTLLASGLTPFELAQFWKESSVEIGGELEKYIGFLKANENNSDSYGDIYSWQHLTLGRWQGVNGYAPNCNLYRDPRWGRAQALTLSLSVSLTLTLTLTLALTLTLTLTLALILTLTLTLTLTPGSDGRGWQD